MKRIKKICTEEGCSRLSRSKGLCEQHYRTMRLSNASECSYEDCSNKAVAKGLCRKHYQKQYREFSK